MSAVLRALNIKEEGCCLLQRPIHGFFKFLGLYPVKYQNNHHFCWEWDINVERKHQHPKYLSCFKLPYYQKNCEHAQNLSFYLFHISMMLAIQQYKSLINHKIRHHSWHICSISILAYPLSSHPLHRCAMIQCHDAKTTLIPSRRMFQAWFSPVTWIISELP